jgi:anti-anti-sigma factor
MTQTASFSSDSVHEFTLVLTLDGKCDAPAAVEAEERIAEALDAGTKEVVFDLRGVSSLEPSMLHTLFRGLVRTKGHGSRFALIRPNASVWTRFEQSGLDRAFSNFPDLEKALATTPASELAELGASR